MNSPLTGPTASTEIGGSILLGRGKPTAATGPMDLISRHADDSPWLASAIGRESLDASTAFRSTADWPRGASLIVRLARENPRWGYRRIVGELKGLGVVVSATTVKQIVREHGLGPAGKRGGPSWRAFLQAQAQSVMAVDFFSVDTAWLQRLYVLFFIEVASRRVYFAGRTAHPDGQWVTQQARHIAWALADRTQPVRFLIRDHDAKFPRSVDAVFEAQGTRIVRTPVRVPQANGIAERFVRTVRSECLDWLLIANTWHLERTLTVCIDHYNHWRPHRSVDLVPPNGRQVAERWVSHTLLVERRDRLGGLLHENQRAA